jgi:hypothetical protein
MYYLLIRDGSRANAWRVTHARTHVAQLKNARPVVSDLHGVFSKLLFTPKRERLHHCEPFTTGPTGRQARRGGLRAA